MSSTPVLPMNPQRYEGHATVKDPVSIAKYVVIFTRHKLALPCSAENRQQQILHALSDFFKINPEFMTLTVEIHASHELFWVHIKANGNSKHEQWRERLQNDVGRTTPEQIKLALAKIAGLNPNCIQVLPVDLRNTTQVALTFNRPKHALAVTTEERINQLWSIVSLPEVLDLVIVTEIKHCSTDRYPETFILTCAGLLTTEMLSLLKDTIAQCTSLNSTLITVSVNN